MLHIYINTLLGRGSEKVLFYGKMSIIEVPGIYRKIYGQFEVYNRGFSCDFISSQFASHHTRARKVSFLFARDGIGKHNIMFRFLLFSSYHNTLHLSDKNIRTHTWLKFQILSWRKSSGSSSFFFCFVLFLFCFVLFCFCYCLFVVCFCFLFVCLVFVFFCFVLFCFLCLFVWFFFCFVLFCFVFCFCLFSFFFLFLFFVFCFLRCTKRKPRDVAKSCPYRCAQRRANPLYCISV